MKTSPTRSCLHLLSLLTLPLLLMAQPAGAQEVKRTFTNMSFEDPKLQTPGCRVYIPSQLVEGWETDHPDYRSENVGNCVVPAEFVNEVVQGGILELWHGPRSNNSGGSVEGRQGPQFAELNAEVASRIYQDVCLIQNERVDYFFSHRGRQSATTRDIMTMHVGTGVGASIVTVGTTNNGAFNTPVVHQGTIQAPAPAGGGWVDYRGQYTYQGASGNGNIGFEAVSAAGGSNQGNFLDDIQVELAPFVDFAQVSSSTPESNAINVPAVRINGTLPSDIVVQVQVTGGSAVLGTDFVFLPGADLVNATTVRLHIPAGTYDWSANGQFPLPIQTVDNTIVDGNRNVQFSILPATDGSYLLASNSSCGGPANTRWDYTIVDDDATVVVTKEFASMTQVAGDPTRYDLVYEIVVNNPSTANTATYNLVDRPGMDPDVGIESASYELNDGSAVTLTPPATGSATEWPLATDRALAPTLTDTYRLSMRVVIARGGNPGNDACTGAPGNGLFNLAAATVEAEEGELTSAACQNTPTPVWVTLDKVLHGRAAAGDQIAVHIYAGGISRAEVRTTGTAAPQTVSTGTHVFAAGNLLGFSDVVGPNNVFSPGTAPTAYDVEIVCSNAYAGSNTVLPSGSGVTESNRQFWGQFSTTAGDDISCTIHNRLPNADLSLVKTVAPETAVIGESVTYTLTVRNGGPGAANNAVVTDPAVPGIDCGAATLQCAAQDNAACPVPAPTVSDLQGSGVVIPTFPAGGSVVLTMACTLTAP
ncbi:DUF11 domain-containing protein [Luteimonas sp. BDR2-5]|uniref:DUF11 domain-containing protein n=1 Tax=Proluteimonas luteida TaxID=2878685 RepID=UPI001E4DA31A|nr:DUF11 domain-containing protein [Luteimonas sp. BDR2-5]MCD9027452.1 DUF11 domain-containing protein [Luteimonas sp. BDR2-5]